MSTDPDQLNFTGLVERLVPVVAELFATLAAQDPLRMSFAGIAEKTVLDIVETLRSEGMSQEAVAATLGLTITGFQAKMKRLRESHRDATAQPDGARQTTLLERVYHFLDERSSGRTRVPYADVERHFSGVKRDTLGGVLHHLAQYDLVAAFGRGKTRAYRVLERPAPHGPTARDASVLLYRHGPLTLSQLSGRLGAPEAVCAQCLTELEENGLLHTGITDQGERTYRASEYHIPVGANEGYEAALLDHVTTVIRAICKKVRLSRRSRMDDRNGGTTFTFTTPVGHPLGEELTAFLANTRVQMEDWLERARALRQTESLDQPWQSITIYTGQMVEHIELE